MNQVYRYMDYSKQAFHQKLNRQLLERQQSLLLAPILRELRLEHPGVGARKLYRILRPEHLGRDRFERLCFELGMKLPRARAPHRTTDSSGVIRFPNLITEKEFTAVNQAWSSDITYYQMGASFCYLTFIVDLFSRRIVGFHVSERLLTEQTTLPALRKALEERCPAAGLIFHSDGGGQYYSKAFVKLTARHGISNSMCEAAYENAHAERVNGTIKNQYLNGYGPQNYRELVEMTKRAVYNYNHVRPHQSLDHMPPAVFEQSRPAGGSSLPNDHFCSSRNLARQHQKNNHSAMSTKSSIQPVQKTVNVI
jgi:putative transposase